LALIDCVVPALWKCTITKGKRKREREVEREIERDDEIVLYYVVIYVLSVYIWLAIK